MRDARAPTWPSRAFGLCLVGVLLLDRSASAQTDGQLWGAIGLIWGGPGRISYELQIEPKVMVVVPEGEPGWATLDVTPSVEYGLTPWLDAIGELVTGYTKQTDDLNSSEVSPQIGARFHLFSRDLDVPVRLPDRPSKRRIVIRDLVRVQSRNLFYNGDKPNSYTWRFRNRLELQVPLTKEDVNDDGARFFMTDWEWFVPIGEPDERFANQQRIRAGFGYRPSERWKFEALYIWNRSRNTADEGFTTQDHVLDLRMKRTF